MWNKPKNEMEEPFDGDTYVPEGTDYSGQTGAQLAGMGIGVIALGAVWKVGEFVLPWLLAD